MSWTTPFASALARRDRTAFAVGHPRHANKFPPPTAKYFDIAAITDTSPPSVPSLGRAVAGLEPAEPQPQLLAHPEREMGMVVKGVLGLGMDQDR